MVEKYHFVLEFFLPVDPSRSVVDIVQDKEVRICLKKKEADWWPRLLYEQKKLSWLKIDFDKWRSHDTDDSDDNENMMHLPEGLTATDALRNKYPDVFRQLQREELGYISDSRLERLLSFNLSLKKNRIINQLFSNFFGSVTFTKFLPKIREREFP